jgi:membrane associated rhomboid family serine protease
VLLSASLIYSRKLTVKAVLVIVLAGGVCVWLLGRSNTVYIGSSGVIYGLMGYLMAVGLFRRELTALLVSLIVFLYYGGALPSLFLVVPGVSWSAHFFGFLSGVGAAWLTRYENKGYASNRRALSRF